MISIWKNEGVSLVNYSPIFYYRTGEDNQEQVPEEVSPLRTKMPLSVTKCIKFRDHSPGFTNTMHLHRFSLWFTTNKTIVIFSDGPCHEMLEFVQHRFIHFSRTLCMAKETAINYDLLALAWALLLPILWFHSVRRRRHFVTLPPNHHRNVQIIMSRDTPFYSSEHLSLNGHYL